MPRGKGFSLIEMLIVIAIIGIIVALLLPAINAARESSRRGTCLNNMRQVGQAVLAASGRNLPASMHHFRDDNGKLSMLPLEKHFPSSYSWRTLILPHIDGSSASDRLDYHVSPWDKKNRDAAGAAIPVFLCPSTALPKRTFEVLDAPLGNPTGRILGETDYEHVFIVATESSMPREISTRTAIPGAWFGKVTYKVGDPHGTGPFEYESKGTRKGASLNWITDGLSKTVMLVEKAGQRRCHATEFGVPTPADRGGAWIEGELGAVAKHAINQSNFSGLYALHPGGAHGVLCDGSARLLSTDLDVDLLVHLCARADGQ